MAENKTKPTTVSVETFIDAVDSDAKREDARVLDALFCKATDEDAVMWGPSIIGYGSYHYVYDTAIRTRCAAWASRRARRGIRSTCSIAERTAMTRGTSP